MKDKQYVAVQTQEPTIVPRGIVESKMTITAGQMDIISILLTEIGKEPIEDKYNRTYVISSKQYADLKGYSLSVAYETLKRQILGEGKFNHNMRHIGFEVYLGDDDFEEYNWFTKISYIKGDLILSLTPEIKELLVDFRDSKEFKVFTQLQYILPMKSVYSKRIYLMCKEFISSGRRFCDNDWELFKEKLGIPTSYNYYKIKTRIIDQAIKEINELTDIFVEYNINEVKVNGGKQPLGIEFRIHKKDEDTLIDSLDMKEDDELKNMSPEELQDYVKKLQQRIKESQ